LATYLIGVEDPRALSTSHMRGALFENLVISEALKHRYNHARRANLSFYRDSGGRECDLVYERADGLAAIEIKSGMTVASDWFNQLDRIAADLPTITTKAVVYGGTEPQRRAAADVVPYTGFADYLTQIDAAPYPAPTPERAEDPNRRDNPGNRYP
jgi:hypothetical protein